MVKGTKLNYPTLFWKLFQDLSLNCSLLFTMKMALLMKSSFFLKMAAERGISLSCFLEVEVILEV